MVGFMRHIGIGSAVLGGKHADDGLAVTGGCGGQGLGLAGGNGCVREARRGDGPRAAVGGAVGQVARDGGVAAVEWCWWWRFYAALGGESFRTGVGRHVPA